MQHEEIPCPFCGKGKIVCDHIPGVYSEKRTGRNALGSGKSIIKSAEVWNVKTDCSNCGKLANEIKKAMKEGVPPDKKKLKKRYEEILKLKEEMKNAGKLWT